MGKINEQEQCHGASGVFQSHWNHHMTYIVAYPHPDTLPRKSTRPIKLGSGSFGEDLLKELITPYPEHTTDLKGATFWKASHQRVA